MADYSGAIQWLLGSSDPSIRYLALTEVLGRSPSDQEASQCRDLITESSRIRSLLSGQNEDGSFWKDPYRKWDGAHWRLVSLVNLAIPPNDSQALKMAENVLDWIYLHASRGRFPVREGRPRMHASVYANPVGTCSYLGTGRDKRVNFLVRTIMNNQWADGGWNCDTKDEANHSSFHESLVTLWGLVMYRNATGSREVDDAIDRSCELFLSHRIFRSHSSGNIIRDEFLKLRYPVYWHYNFLEAMRVLCIAGKGRDPRMTEALDLLESKCGKDGKWAVEGTYWRTPVPGEKRRAGQEAVDWGRSGPNEMITLNALRVLQMAGRL